MGLAKVSTCALKGWFFCFSYIAALNHPFLFISDAKISGKDRGQDQIPIKNLATKTPRHKDYNIIFLTLFF
jgi:hypothetical protein